MVDFVRKRFWLVLPYASVRGHRNLRISPLGVVPQRERRPRIIVDYTYSGVNDDTIRMAPREAMQFGRALDRILLAILQAPDDQGPVYILKIDISDGFYRIRVRPADVPKLALVLPREPGEQPLIAMPLSLPMGWTESPPWFCSATETVVDLANAYCGTRWEPPAHRLESLASTATTLPQGLSLAEPPVPPNPEHAGVAAAPWRAEIKPRPPHYARRPNRGPCLHTDVFVDDKIVVAQGGLRRLRRIKRQLLHLNDQVFRPLDPTGGSARQEPVSVKKLRKGDATWCTRKTVLGWEIDTLRKTISLPPHRLARLNDIITQASTSRHITQQQAHRMLGEIRSMALGIPGAPGLLSMLQHALTEALRRKKRVRLRKATRDHLLELLRLAHSVTTRPTRMAELFPSSPAHVHGLCDASGSGMGGVFFPSPTLGHSPVAWRTAVPPDIQAQLVTFDNPRGTVTNSDLELAGTILHNAVAATLTPPECTFLTGCDNLAAVNWRHKGSNSLDGPSAYLLRASSLQQRRLRYLPRLAYVPGTANTLADAASRHSTLARASPAARLSFQRDLSSAVRTAQEAVTRDRARTTTKVWERCWLPFLADLNLHNPFLTGIPDKIPILRVFAVRLRDGRLSRSGQRIRAAHVRDEVLHVAKTFTELGAPDPRYTDGKMDPRLTSLFKGMVNQDPAPVRVKPMPLSILHHAERHGDRSNPLSAATLDMAWIAVFYLLRPGEYCKSPDNSPLCFRDITLLIGTRKLDTRHCPLGDFDRATSSSITFDDQKNRERGEVLAQGLSGHRTACPTRALARRLQYLRRANAAADAPICTVWTTRRIFVTSALVTKTLQASAAALPHLGFPAAEISSRSMRAGGAMALLCGRVDADTIRLVGRWRSNAMFRYLHAQALPLVRSLARTMLQHGNFTLAPGADVPATAIPLLQPAP